MKRFIRSTIIFLFLSVTAAYAQDSFRLGVNLDANGAFVNIVDHTARYGKAVSYDSLGWPQSDFDLVLIDGRPVAEWTGTIDDPEQYRVDYSGRYACRFTGSASVRATGTAVSIENSSYDAQSNTTTFDLVVGGFPGANHGLVFLSFTNTRRTAGDTLNSGITGLTVNRPGYPLNTTKIFTDEYIALCKAADFACYRFYNLQNIWSGEPTYPAKTIWRQRKTPGDAAQVSMASLNGKRDGWCWEYIVELANILRKDIWICIHISCDSQYVASLATYLKSALDPSITIYVENSNEVWSPTHATHGPYNQADAQARGISFDHNYARRTVELSRWFAAVFGESEINNRVRVILAGQHAYVGRTDNHLNYIRNQLGEPKDFIYATSTALYFGSTKSDSPDPVTINSGMLEAIADQIENPLSTTYRRAHLEKANSWGFKGGCTSYEGGPHLPSGGGAANLGPQILAHRTAVMREVLKTNYLEGWKALGGGLAIYFTLASGYNRYGCWGLTDDYTKPDRNEKMRAIREIIGGVTGSKLPRTAPGNALRLYPNPATSVLFVENTEADPIRILDLGGREVWQGRGGATEVIDLARWQPGMYCLYTRNHIRWFIKF